MKKITAYKIVLFSLLAGLTFALKFVMAPLPNIEPVTLLLSIFTILFGFQTLYIIVIYVGLEILIYGFSLWSLGYLYIWVILLVLTKITWAVSKSYIAIVISNALFGVLFGALYIPLYCLTSGFETAIVWWANGILYDLIHCASNFIITLLIFKPLYHLLNRMYINSITRISDCVNDN